MQHEGLAECDSLEKEAVGVELNNIMAETDNEDVNFIVSSASSRNLWVKTENPTEWWQKYTWWRFLQYQQLLYRKLDEMA